jgi:hypothetical protein
MVSSHIACIAIVYLAWCVSERIPDGWATAVLIPGAFNLIRGCSSAPDKALRKGKKKI